MEEVMAQLMQLNPIKSRKATDTIIGEGLIFSNAMLKGSGVIRIDGHYTGNIEIKGHIILGETGVINGDVTADSAMIAGHLTGKVQIKNTLHLCSTADLDGKIESGTLKIDEGAVFSALCTVSKKSSLDSIPLDETKQLKSKNN